MRIQAIITTTLTQFQPLPYLPLLSSTSDVGWGRHLKREH